MSVKKISAPKGTKDVLPIESYKWQYIENKLRKLCRVFNFGELRTPTFEHTELFLRGVGDTTDVVSKEMYTFKDKGDRSITLRPEGTAGIARSFVENGLYGNILPQKLYYLISCFRYEKPQAGRLREFHQFGVEIMGTKEPSSDAEAIMIAERIFREFEIKDIVLNLNNIGCKECREIYNEKLIEFLSSHKSELCPTCQERLHKNPMRVFDCKSSVCSQIVKDAPTIFDNVCDSCKSHFDHVTEILDMVGIKYKIDKSIVRGLDYYTKTVFEFVSENIGAQGTVLGGGRYDGLISEIGGNDAPGVGFAMGLERLLLLMNDSKMFDANKNTPSLLIIPIGDVATKKAYDLLVNCRNENISAELDLNARSVKAQMKYGDKLEVKHTLVIGEDEIENNSYNIKNMISGEMLNVKYEEIIGSLKHTERLK